MCYIVKLNVDVYLHLSRSVLFPKNKKLESGKGLFGRLWWFAGGLWSFAGVFLVVSGHLLVVCGCLLVVCSCLCLFAGLWSFVVVAWFRN